MAYKSVVCLAAVLLIVYRWNLFLFAVYSCLCPMLARWMLIVLVVRTSEAFPAVTFVHMALWVAALLDANNSAAFWPPVSTVALVWLVASLPLQFSSIRCCFYVHLQNKLVLLISCFSIFHSILALILLSCSSCAILLFSFLMPRSLLINSLHSCSIPFVYCPYNPDAGSYTSIDLTALLAKIRYMSVATLSLALFDHPLSIAVLFKSICHPPKSVSPSIWIHLRTLALLFSNLIPPSCATSCHLLRLLLEIRVCAWSWPPFLIICRW